MPGKSKRGKGRRPQFKNRQRQTAPAQPNQTAVAAPAATVPAPVKAVSKVTVSTAATTTQYPFFTSELRRIGVITGIIVVILAVLAVILT